MTDLPQRLRWWLDDRFPDPRQRARAAALAAGILLCAAWIGLFAVRAGADGGQARPARPTAAMRHAAELQSRLRAADPAFAGVIIRPHLDYPGRLHITGAAPDAEALRAKIAELDPEARAIIELR